MIGVFSARLFEGIAAPRRSARWVMGQVLSMRDALILVALGATLSLIVEVVGIDLIYLASYGGRDSAGTLIPDLIRAAITSAVLFFAVSGVAHRIGMRRGGQASYAQIAAVVAWWMVIEALLTVPILIAFSEVLQFPEGYDLTAQTSEQFQADVNAGVVGFSAGALLVCFGLGLYTLWILASFLAEAHGFESPASVLFAVVGLAMCFSLIFLVFIGAFAGG
jgi:hypothetical protein